MTRTSELVAIGTRDLVPPQGRVTLELRSATSGRLRKRVQVENALMDWYKAAVLRNGGRGRFDVTATIPNPWVGPTGANPLGIAQGAGGVVPAERSITGLAVPGRWPADSGVARNASGWLWATAANVSPDATKTHIPTVAGVEVTAGGLLSSATWVPDGVQNKRGTLNTALSGRTWDRIRMVVDFSTSEGNGTYRSIGIGTLVNQRLAPGGLRPFPAALNAAAFIPSSVTSTPTGGNPLTTINNTYHVRPGYNSDMWFVDTSFRLNRLNLLVGVQGTAGVQISAANVPGSGGPLGPVTQPTPTDFWVARNQVLYRCVTPVANVAMTVTNTYNLAGTLGAEAILDMTYDGTNLYLLTLTKVYVVDPATGASTSNWTHSLSGGTLGYQSIGYDAAEQLLWINFVDRTTGGTIQWGATASGSPLVLNFDSLICYGFTTAGTLTKWHMGRHTGTQGSTQTSSRQISGIRTDGLVIGRLNNDANSDIYDFFGPSMASHALLGSDVVKTSNDVLRITYDFDFA